MKKNIFYLLLLTIICLTRQVSAQCDLPDLVNINTGSNMTVFFTSDAVADLPISSDAPYMVAIQVQVYLWEVHLLLQKIC